MGSKSSKSQAHAEPSADSNTKQDSFACDVVLSLSAESMKIATSIANALRANELSVYLDETAKFRRNGKAIVESKVLVLLLDANAARAKGVKDDLSLAYITSKPIIPVYVGDKEAIFASFSSDTKLILEGLDGVEFSPKAKSHDVTELAAAIRAQSAKGPSRKTVAEEADEGETLHPQKGDFWQRHFKGETTLTWQAFEDKFRDDYSKDLSSRFPGDSTDWLLATLHTWLFRSQEKIDHARYELWCKRYDLMLTMPFWNIVQLVAKQAHAIREVFDVDSTVRLDAIQNLTKFQNPQVIEALRKLLKDKEANVRAVAAASLGRVRRVAGEDSAEMTEALLSAEDALIATLNDRDRLVRESTCLSLANLKSRKGIPGIVHLWRNDAISTVRAAALLSLEHIGGPEAEEAMHLTKVLTSEIQALQETMRK